MSHQTLKKKLYRVLHQRNQPASVYLRLRRKARIFNEGYAKNKLHAVKARGCLITDVSGHIYIDTAMGAGTHLLGYAPGVLTKAVKEQSSRGTLYILPNLHAYQLGRLLTKAIGHFDSFVFCNTGSEATMRACRIARAYTGRKKIAMFSGGWHGGHDGLLFDEDYKGRETAPKIIFKSAGVPDELKDLVLILPYHCDSALTMIRKHKDELAMVIIEPVQGSNPRDDMGEFLKELRGCTAKNKVLLCFDEIISGFRLAPGGAQEYYGVKADLATYGKALGGGLPIGVVAGPRSIMNVVTGQKSGRTVFMGGTFSANPLGMCVARTFLEYLLKNKKRIYPLINDHGQYLRDSVNAFCLLHRIPVRMMGIGSMSRLIFTDRAVRSRWQRDHFEISREIQDLFYLYLLLEKGIHVNHNRILYLSTAHHREHVQRIIDAITETLQYFSKKLKLI
ncbi:MAG: aminotransferase class III-fold pyridoxal phosphate-dependent enzyme [Candidatus Omnitrophota bacterium]|nr:aminotransferase class III-fold pyridoxal phosphate-dependent enzyme [Candidatus Omnitrophota bacterium]